MDTSNLIALFSIGANVVLVLVVYSFKTTIRLSIVEAIGALKDTLTSDYATKDEVQAVEKRLMESIGLRDEIRSGFARFIIKRNETQQ